jgi:hypothetical protein
MMRRRTCGGVRTEAGEEIAARYLITAVGCCLSTANVPRIEGLGGFRRALVPHRRVAA